MSKKLLLLLVIIFLLTGCTTKYNIYIDDDSIKEEIVTKIEGNEINSKSNDEVISLIKNEQYPFNDEHAKYDKKVSNVDGGTTVRLTYDYLYDEYTRSKSYKCFDNRKISNVNGALDIEFSGTFHCLMSNTVTINIFTDKKVSKTNADKVKGNKYTWYINNSNIDNTSIILKTKENKDIDLLIIFMFLFISCFLIGTIILYFNYNKNTISINKI